MVTLVYLKPIHGTDVSTGQSTKTRVSPPPVDGAPCPSHLAMR